ncbi:MAG: hypothetical protein J5527_06600 [Treponema sp.]|nr:hypothetical protein [Treponema sp.]
MIKKNLLIFIIFSIFNLCIYSNEYILDTPTPDCKISYYKDGGYWLAQGFDFSNYSPTNDPGLEQLVKNEINKVSAFDDYNKNYVVVGHSQGGPRALAYATMLKQLSKNNPNKYDYNQLKAVITCSGIDKGIKALDGGILPFKNKVICDIDILANGIAGCVGAFDFIGLKTAVGGEIGKLFFKEGKNILVTSVLTNVIFEFICSCIGDINPDLYLAKAWAGAPEKEIQQIYDMMPKSKFIKNYVSDVEQKTVKYKSGTKKEYYWTYKKIGWIKIYYLTYRTVPVYKTYTYEVDKPKFDMNLPVGYIVGTNNDSIRLIDAFSIDKATGKMTNEASKKVRNVQTGLTVGFGIGAAANMAEAIIGYASLNVIAGVSHTVDFAKCTAATDLCINLDDHLNRYKNSTENDGLVAKESQYIPMTQTDLAGNKYTVHTKVLGKNPKGYIEYKNYNHLETEPVYYESPVNGVPLKTFDNDDINLCFNVINRQVKELIKELN